MATSAPDKEQGVDKMNENDWLMSYIAEGLAQHYYMRLSYRLYTVGVKTKLT